jgi:CheY-like chemotaxis protein
MKGYTTTRRLILLSAIAALTIGTLTGFALRELALWDSVAARLARESQESSLDGIFHSALTRATGEAVSFAATGNQEYAREATDALVYAQSAMAQLRRINSERPPTALDEGIRALREDQEELLSRVRRTVAQALRTVPSPEAMPAERLERLYAPEADADRTWMAVLAWHDNERKTLSRELRTHKRRVLALVGGTILVSLLWSILVYALASRWLIAPIRRLAQVAQRMAEGDFDQRVAHTHDGAIGTLQRSLDLIAHSQRPPLPDDGARRNQSAPAELASTPSAETDAGAAAPDRAEAGPDSPKRALLLATEPAERDLTRAMLQHCGVTVTVAETGSAIEMAPADGAYDLIVIDGLHAANSASAMLAENRPRGPAGQRVPVIILSAEDDSTGTPRWFVASADTQLRRPFSFFDLHAALQRTLGEA